MGRLEDLYLKEKAERDSAEIQRENKKAVDDRNHDVDIFYDVKQEILKKLEDYRPDPFCFLKLKTPSGDLDTYMVWQIYSFDDVLEYGTDTTPDVRAQGSYYITSDGRIWFHEGSEKTYSSASRSYEIDIKTGHFVEYDHVSNIEELNSPNKKTYRPLGPMITELAVDKFGILMKSWWKK